MKLPEFQQFLQSMSWADFESFVVDLLRSSGKFTEIRLHQNVMGHEIDIVATEVGDPFGLPATCFFKTKASRVVPTDVIDRVVALPSMLRGFVSGPVRTILVASGLLTKAAQARAAGVGIEVWDSLKLNAIKLRSGRLVRPVEIGDAHTGAASGMAIGPGSLDGAGRSQSLQQTFEY
ncbi:MAG: restriction endonuclease [Rhodocyclaceae bacterium]|nr:restriction endonuclease [Rhodocyclaceae bacterium]